MLEMLEAANHRWLEFFIARPDATDRALFFAMLIAQWTIIAVPGILVFLWILGSRQDRVAAVRAFATVLLALLLALFISSIYMHPRPFMDTGARNFLQHAPDSSFPSDHCTLLFAVGASLLIFRPVSAPYLWILPSILALAIGWARVYLGAHYPLDIIGAAIVAGAATLILANQFAGRTIARITSLGEYIYQWLLWLMPEKRNPER